MNWWKQAPPTCDQCRANLAGHNTSTRPLEPFAPIAGRCSYCCTVEQVLQHPDGLAWLLRLAAAVNEDTAVLRKPLAVHNPNARS